MSLHHGVLWAAHSVGLKLTCISGPICQKGGGGVGSKFSGLVWGKKPASFTGLLGPGAQACKPKPFISEVHTKAEEGEGK